MEKSEILVKIQEIFRDVFEDDELIIFYETNAGDIEGWDSLEHINLIVNIESEFKVKFEISEINDMQNIGEMIEIIYKKLN